MNKLLAAGALLLGALATVPALAQVKTQPPPVVAGAKPVTVERIKIHGASLSSGHTML